MAKAHVYNRDHINTDEIIPARYLNTDDEQELATHCLEDLDEGLWGRSPRAILLLAGRILGAALLGNMRSGLFEG